ncbi:MAG: hypothetical protein OEW89_12085 [Gammaproteobacteria bacterium]|nr:hypothetical protein [Gammaproteobacteria bacterium]MDH5593244.1 hypothetical protein [Gammaproteobacteria bacterium]MDH5613471.1 hypothetical protein [Gammaproteobacteria bacterium]
MEISSVVYNPASAQQSRARSESEDILQKKLEEQLTNEVAPNPEEKAFKEAEKVEAAQTAQEKATVENREQSEKRQGRAIDVTV